MMIRSISQTPTFTFSGDSIFSFSTGTSWGVNRGCVASSLASVGSARSVSFNGLEIFAPLEIGSGFWTTTGTGAGTGAGVGSGRNWRSGCSRRLTRNG